MINLADTSIRVYRKKNGKISLKLRSYMIINTNTSFRLSTYLKEISCTLKLSSEKVISFDTVSFSEDTTCTFQMKTMVHDFWASAVIDMKNIKNQVGVLTLNYRLSFTDHPTEEQESIQYTVPIINIKYKTKRTEK